MQYLTDIREDNIQYCEKMMRVGIELRHLEGVKGNFGIADRRECITILLQAEGEPPTRALVTNVRSFVEQQQYFFDTLWQKAIPAEQRITEIEEGVKPAFMETIRDPAEIQKIGSDLIRSAKQEVLIIFSTSKAFLRQDKAGTMELVKEAAVTRGLKVRILVPVNDTINETIGKLRTERKMEYKKLIFEILNDPYKVGLRFW